MALTPTLVHEATTSGNSTTGKTWTYTPTDPCFLVFARGYVNDASDIFPASITWGGQSVSRVQVAAAFNAGGTFVEVAFYWANATTVAAMSGGAGSMTYGTTLALAYEINLGVVAVPNAQDSLVGSDHVDGAYTSRDITLTTASGDLCFMICVERADQGGLTTASGMTDFETLAASSAVNIKANVKIDHITASGASTTVAIDGDADEQSASIGVALRETVGGGGLSIPVAMNHRRTMEMR